jgi:hypothetical protein
MPADAIFEGLARLFGRLFAEAFFEIGCYYLGLGILRLLSLGEYPPAAPSRPPGTGLLLRRPGGARDVDRRVRGLDAISMTARRTKIASVTL